MPVVAAVRDKPKERLRDLFLLPDRLVAFVQEIGDVLEQVRCAVRRQERRPPHLFLGGRGDAPARALPPPIHVHVPLQLFHTFLSNSRRGGLRVRHELFEKAKERRTAHHDARGVIRSVVARALHGLRV